MPEAWRQLAPAVLLATAVALLVALDGLWRLDRLAEGVALGLVPAGPGEDVVVVAIDERSLAELGSWPWPRGVHVRLVERLGEAAAVGFGIALIEPDRERPADDAALVEAIRSHGRVVLPILIEAPMAGAPPIEVPPFPPLAEVARLGHADLPLDADGVLRRTRLWGGIAPPLWPSLPLAMLQLAVPERAAEIVAQSPPPAEEQVGTWAMSRPLLMPFADFDVAPWIVSAVDLHAGRLDPASFHGRLVLVGVTATALAEHVLVPDGLATKRVPAIVAQAQILAGLAGGNLIEPVSHGSAAVAASTLVLLAGLLLATGCPLRRAVALTTLGPPVVSLVLLFGLGLWLSPMGGLLGGVGLVLLELWQARRRANAALAATREREHATLEAIGDAIVGTDSARRITYVNPAAEALLGVARTALIGAALTERLRLREPGTGVSVMGRLFGEARANRTPVAPWLADLDAGNGATCRVRVVARRLPDFGPQPGGYVLVLSDLTELGRLQDRLVHEATHDALTGLPNRQLLLDHLGRALARARRAGAGGLAVLFVDLDRFKAVNDGLGHAAGDELLRAVASRLLGVCRAEDLVARLSGDEFVIVVETLRRRQHAAHVAQKVLVALEQPFEVADQELFVGVSVGIALFPGDGKDAETLLRHADAAMYGAKGQGGDVRFFSPELNSRALDQLVLQRDLRHAIRRDELLLHYQPKVMLKDGSVAGFEALLRWRRKSGELVSPGLFIPVAESTGLIEPLTEWVMRAACRQGIAWRAAGQRALPLAVNISARQFQHSDLVAFVARILAETGFAAGLLQLELTESMIMREPEQAVPVLEALKGMGVTIAVDDFGTGYSSLAYLRRFPIDCLKIDRSFVAAIGRDRRDDEVVAAIVALAHSLEIRVVAEGVETRAQADFLAALGCEEAQGFLYSPPVPPERVPLQPAA